MVGVLLDAGHRVSDPRRHAEMDALGDQLEGLIGARGLHWQVGQLDDAVERHEFDTPRREVGEPVTLNFLGRFGLGRL